MDVNELEERMRVANHNRSEDNLFNVIEGYMRYAFEDGKVLVESKNGKIVTAELENLHNLRVVKAYTSSSLIDGQAVTSIIPLEDLMILVASVNMVDGIMFNRGDDSFSYLDGQFCKSYMSEIDQVKDPLEIVASILERYELIGIDDEI